jgi:hypothetical protein
LFGEINLLRNDALHGNAMSPGRLIVPPAKQPLHMFAALLYRMILTAYLDLKLAPRKPDTGLTKYENFRLDHFESGEYQRHIEAGLSTIMYAGAVSNCGRGQLFFTSGAPPRRLKRPARLWDEE